MRIFKIFKPIIWYFDLDFSFSWKWWHNRRVWKQLCNFSAAYFMRNVREGMDFLFASFNKSHIYRWIKVLNPHVSLFLKTFYFSLAALFLIFLGFTAPVRDLRDISNWEWSMSFEQDKHEMFRLPADSMTMNISRSTFKISLMPTRGFKKDGLLLRLSITRP